MINVFIGISEKFRCIEGMTERSIIRNTDAKVNIIHIYPEVEAGCTGFSNVRYDIRYGIYLDADMIVLGDIAELWSYSEEGKFVCMQDGSTEVAAIDCSHLCRNKHNTHKLPLLPTIPAEWNVEDKVVDGMKLLHFTDLDTQPWFDDHPNKEAVAIYEEYK